MIQPSACLVPIESLQVCKKCGAKLKNECGYEIKFRDEDQKIYFCKDCFLEV